MALSKEIVLDNGITVNYHRIVSVNIITNMNNIIEIASYTSDDKRDEEKDALTDGKHMNIFMRTTYVNTEYDQSMTVEDAYKWIKELPEFEGAEDC